MAEVRVYQHEIDEKQKALRLRVRRKRGNRKLISSGCGRRLEKAHDTSEREVRDLPCNRQTQFGALGAEPQKAGAQADGSRRSRVEAAGVDVGAFHH